MTYALPAQLYDDFTSTSADLDEGWSLKDTLAKVLASPINQVESALPFIQVDQLAPQSSNASIDDLKVEHFLLEGKTPVETGSSSIVWLKRHHKPLSIFHCVYKAEGIVTSVEDTSFTAKLMDLRGNLPDEEAEFPIEEISEDDRRFVTPGSVFYWSMGYEVLTSGQKMRSSVIRFRRLPMWTSKELARIKKEAAELSSLFK